MTSFSITTLSGHRALVRGEDSHGTKDEAILDTTQWDEIKAHFAGDSAMEDFDAAVSEFFAPILEAQKTLEAAVKARETDPLATLVVHEPVEATAGHAGLTYELTKDSQVLRLIEEGKYNQLVWVKGTLEIVTDTVTVTYTDEAYDGPAVEAEVEDGPGPEVPNQGAGVVNFVMDDSQDQA